MRSRRGGGFLAELLDVEGAVQLAHALASRPSPQPVLESAEDALALARRRLDHAEEELGQPLCDPYTGASLVPLDRIEHALERAGLPAVRQRKALERAGLDLFAPVESRALQRLSAGKRLLDEVRRSLGPLIAQKGPQEARLEQLDAALAAATAARTEALVSRAVAATGDAFAAELERFVMGLPEGELDVASALLGSGLVQDSITRCETLIVAAFRSERQRLDVLVHQTLGERLP